MATKPSTNVIDTSIPAMLSTLAQKALVRPNNPPAGIAGYLFDITGDERLEFHSDSTDHYVEDNTALQDQIALRPETITIHGTVAELTTAQVQPAPFNPPPDSLPVNQPMKPPSTPGALQIQAAAIAKTVTTLTGTGVLSGLGPGAALSSAVKNAGQQVISSLQDRVYSVADSAVRMLMEPANAAALLKNAVALPDSAQAAVNVLQTLLPESAQSIIGALKTPGIPSSQLLLSAATKAPANQPSSVFQNYSNTQPTPPKATRQTSAMLFLYQLWKSRTLFTVQTAWGIWADMIIADGIVEQLEDSRDKTDFTITFKHIRVAQSVTVNVGQLAGRNAMQAGASQPTQNGNLSTTDATASQQDSILYTWATSGLPPTP